MAEIEQFSRLLGDIYDASLDPALWPEAFAKACGTSAPRSQPSRRKTR